MAGRVFAALLPVAASLVTRQTPEKSVVHWNFLYDVNMEPIPKHNLCNIAANESCGAKAMPKNEYTKIVPGGMTECISAGKREFSFSVFPRRLDKVLLYFEGGGACWDHLSTMLGACKFTDTRFKPFHGVIVDHPENPFREYTVVFVPSCAGDLHTGNVSSHAYGHGLTGSKFKQRGYYNTMSVLEWIKSSLNTRKLTNFLLMGESAGAIAVQVWAAKMLNELSYERASVISDSYAGIFPPAFQGPVFKKLGACDVGVLDWNPDLAAKCKNETIVIPDCYEATIRAFPNVHFGSIMSKYDTTQMAFYNLASQTVGGRRNQTNANFRREVADVLARYAPFPNHVSFLASSTWHVFTKYIYEEGPYTHVAFGRRLKLQEHVTAWLRHFDTHDAGRSWCELSSDTFSFKTFLGRDITDHCEPTEGQTFDRTDKVQL